MRNPLTINVFTAAVYGPSDCFSRSFRREDDARAWARATVEEEVGVRVSLGKADDADADRAKWKVEVHAETFRVY